MKTKENLLRVIRHNSPEWVPNGMESVVWIMPPVVERPSKSGPDAFGVRWALEEGAEGGTYPAHGGHAITDLSKWRRQITIPDVSALDWDPVAKRAKEIDREQKLVCGFVEMGLFERSYLLLGMDEALVSYLTEPDLMEDLLSVVADYKIELIETFDDAADLDILWYGDDWGTQDNLFMPPETWRRIIKPHTKRIYQCAKKRGIIVDQHSCGKIESIFGDIVEMGAELWNPCQPCNDLAGLKRKYGGRIAFCGGIDSQFVLGRPGVTPEEVRAEVRKRIDEMAEGGGYVAAPSHDVPYRPEIVNAMNEEIVEYGHSVYKHTQKRKP
jgi:uroporphyrinogen-III decarboxylase